jgi:hypothetical protein
MKYRDFEYFPQVLKGPSVGYNSSQPLLKCLLLVGNIKQSCYGESYVATRLCAGMFRLSADFMRCVHNQFQTFTVNVFITSYL